MTKQYAMPKRLHPTGGFVVRTPRAIDAIGQTLRIAYGGNDVLPCDIARCLDALDRIKRH